MAHLIKRKKNIQFYSLTLRKASTENKSILDIDNAS